MDKQEAEAVLNSGPALPPGPLAVPGNRLRGRHRVRMGRKDYAALFCLVGPISACTLFTFLRVMSAETYVGFLQLYVPAVLLPYFGGNVAQKVFASREPTSERAELREGPR